MPWLMKSTHYKTCNFIMKLVPIFDQITMQSVDVTIGIAQLINTVIISNEKQIL